VLVTMLVFTWQSNFSDAPFQQVGAPPVLDAQ
jgi:hypothetical protein